MTDIVQPSRRAVAEPLVKAAKPDEVVAWFCTNCGTVYKTKEEAERCTVKRGDIPSECCTEWSCEECGAPSFSVYQRYCHGCMNTRRAKREQESLAKAEKVIEAKDYPEDQGVVYDGKFYCSIEGFVEHCEDEGIEVPARVWATTPSKFALNADEILDYAWECFLDGCDELDMSNIEVADEFRAAVKSFNEQQKATMYWECGTAVDLTT